MNRRLSLLVLALALSAGCSWHARKLLNVETKIDERVKQSVQIADESLDAQPPQHRTRQTDIASQAVHDAAVLLGYPLEDQRPLVAGLLSINEKLRKDSEEAWSSKRKADSKLRAIQMHQLRELQTLGQQMEEEHNKSVVHKWWTAFKVFFGVGALGGIIYLLVISGAIFVIGPPILGWLYGVLIRTWPKLANFLKVVPIKAFQRVTASVEIAKMNNAATNHTVEQTGRGILDEHEKDLVREQKLKGLADLAEQDKKKSEAAAKAREIVSGTELVSKGNGGA